MARGPLNASHPYGCRCRRCLRGAPAPAHRGSWRLGNPAWLLLLAAGVGFAVGGVLGFFAFCGVMALGGLAYR